jgi:WD40 repeat protein/tRNA A-37 threonylcarbamoyl transferase component Bud32
MLFPAPDSDELSLQAWGRVEETVAAFTGQWTAGRIPDPEEFLPRDVDRQALLVELIHADMRQRAIREMRFAVEDYLRAFPELEQEQGIVLGFILREYELCRSTPHPVSRQQLEVRFPHLAGQLQLWLPPPSEAAVDDTSISDAQGTVSETEAGTLRLTEAAARLADKGYEILGELGRGGSSVVFQARDEKLKRIVALKVIRPALQDEEVLLNRLRAEAEILAGIQHPNILQVYEVGEFDGAPYLALEYAPLGSLETRLKGAPCSAATAAKLMETLARAVHEAHQRRIVHRDLKPSNILLTGNGAAPLAEAIPKLADFGLAKQFDVGLGHTHTGTILGTPSYMAPEQAAGHSHHADPRVDIYALGAILFELLTGRPPFQGPTMLDTLQQVREQPPVAPRQLQPKTPRDLETICLKCLEKSPDHRYQSALELAEDLDRFSQGRPIKARAVGTVERAWRWSCRNPLVAGLSAAVILLLVAGLVVTTGLWLSAERTGNQLRKQLYLADMQRASDAWRAGHVDEVAVLLDRASLQQPDLQGFAWHFFDGYRQRMTTTLDYGTRRCWIDVSPDGTVVAAAGDDNGVKLWSLADGRLLATLWPGDRRPVLMENPTFSGDGSLLAAADDHVVTVWELHDRDDIRLKTQLNRAPQPNASTLEFLPDGERLAVGYDNREIVLWNVNTAARETVLHCDAKFVVDLAVSPDGRRLAATAFDELDQPCKFVLWNLADGQKRIFDQHRKTVGPVAFSPDGRLLAKGATDGTIQMWDVVSRRLIRTLEKHADAVRDLAFSPDGIHLASASHDRTVKYWEVPTGKLLETHVGHTHFVSSVDFTPDGRRIVSGGYHGKVKVREVQSGRPVVLSEHQTEVVSLDLAPDGRRLATADVSGIVHIWDVDTLQKRATLVDPRGSKLAKIRFIDGGRRLAVLTDAHTVEVWNVQDGRHEDNAADGQRPGICLAAVPDRAGFVVAARDGRELQVWDLSQRTPAKTFHSPAKVRDIAVSPGGDYLAAVGNAKEIFRWDLRTQRPMPPLRGLPSDAYRAVFSPQGDLFVTLSQREIRLWDWAAGSFTATLEDRANVVAVAVSPDGRTLAAGTEDGTVSLWNLLLRQRVAELAGHTQGVTALAFTTDSRTLISASYDGTVRVWGAAP